MLGLTEEDTGSVVLTCIGLPRAVLISAKRVRVTSSKSLSGERTVHINCKIMNM